uniref:Uncharacterized protein n=1 Tax=Macaca fascicularis TaxID=9541 RepID=Q9GMW2_MACFA|nr:hypothetical protein [Macaca fascicularis]
MRKRSFYPLGSVRCLRSDSPEAEPEAGILVTEVCWESTSEQKGCGKLGGGTPRKGVPPFCKELPSDPEGSSMAQIAGQICLTLEQGSWQAFVPHAGHWPKLDRGCMNSLGLLSQSTMDWVASTTETYCLTDLAARRPKARCW